MTGGEFGGKPHEIRRTFRVIIILHAVGILRVICQTAAMTIVITYYWSSLWRLTPDLLRLRFCSSRNDFNQRYALFKKKNLHENVGRSRIPTFYRYILWRLRHIVNCQTFGIRLSTIRIENVITSKPKAHNIALLSTMYTAVVFRIFCLIVLKTRRRLRRRHCVMQFLFSIRKPIILSSRNMRRTDRNIHAGMVIMVRRSPVVDFEKTALSVCLHERFHHIIIV